MVVAGNEVHAGMARIIRHPRQRPASPLSRRYKALAAPLPKPSGKMRPSRNPLEGPCAITGTSARSLGFTQMVTALSFMSCRKGKGLCAAATASPCS